MAISSWDMLLEIFSWLPAKVIHKFKCIDKFFLESLQETYFALKQANNALTKDDCCFFIRPSIVERWSYCYVELHHLLRDEAYAGVPDDALEFLRNYSLKILASSNGLILCAKTMHNKVELFVINPATRSYFPIPTPEEVRECVQNGIFVFECDLRGYKVLLLYNFEWSSYLDCQVFSSEEGVWRMINSSFFIGGRNLRFDMPALYNGAIHFISDRFPYFEKNSPYFNPYIASFNYENGMSRMLRLPKEVNTDSKVNSHCEMGIFRWGKVGSEAQSLCMVVLEKESVFTMWVLTNYELSSWRMIMEATVEAMVGIREQNPIVTGYSVLNGEYLVFTTETKVYGYNLTQEKNMEIDEIGEYDMESSYISIMPYSNTLRPSGTSQFPLSYYAAIQKEVMQKYLPISSLSLEEYPREDSLSFFQS